MMTISSKHFRIDLLPLFPKQNQTNNDYKNDALARLRMQLREMDRNTTIQAIKCTIREINGGNIDHNHPDLDLLIDKNDFKYNTEIVTANLNTFPLFSVNKTRGAIILLFHLCKNLATKLSKPVTIVNNPSRAQKEEFIRQVLLDPSVSEDGLTRILHKL